MPCGTDRSDPVQMLKITPVLPGAITEKGCQAHENDDRREADEYLARELRDVLRRFENRGHALLVLSDAICGT